MSCVCVTPCFGTPKESCGCPPRPSCPHRRPPCPPATAKDRATARHVVGTECAIPVTRRRDRHETAGAGNDPIPTLGPRITRRSRHASPHVKSMGTIATRFLRRAIGGAPLRSRNVVSNGSRNTRAWRRGEATQPTNPPRADPAVTRLVRTRRSRRTTSNHARRSQPDSRSTTCRPEITRSVSARLLARAFRRIVAGDAVRSACAP